MGDCTFHGGVSATGTDTTPCRSCELAKMRPVYDAAMELKKNHGGPWWHEHSAEVWIPTKVWEAFIEACVKAEEVERG